ncbi:MAG: PAS domain S-box protein [Magnetococcus sp. WYHC-3]
MFHLTRYFTLLSGLVFVIISVPSVWFFWTEELASYIRFAEQSNVGITRLVAHTIWPQYEDYLENPPSLEPEDVRSWPGKEDLLNEIRQVLTGLNILKVKIYHSSGMTLYSTEFAQIGNRVGDKPSFLESAIRGQVQSQHSYREKFHAIEGLVTHRHVVETYIPVRNQDGHRIIGVFEIYTDISDAVTRLKWKTIKLAVGMSVVLGGIWLFLVSIVRRAEHILAARNREIVHLGRRNQSLLEAAGEGIIGIGTDGLVTFVNPAAAQVLGRSAQDILNRNLHQLSHHTRPDGSAFPASDCPIRNALTGVHIQNTRDQFWRADGAAVPVEYTAHPLHDGSDITGAVVVFRDISERLEAERSLRESEEKFRLVAQSAHDAIIIANQSGNIVFWNLAAARLFGHTREEILGQSLTQLIPAPLCPMHQAGLERARDSGMLVHAGKVLEVPGLHRDGHAIPLEATLSMWRTDAGVFFTSVLRDVSSRKQVAEEMENARRLAEEANTAKSQFLANMSHEIRTPMNAIIGMSQLALQASPDDRMRDYLFKIHDASHSLLRIINDILDFSKIEAGKLEIEWADFNLDDLIRNLMAMVGLQAHGKGLELILLKDPAVPCRFRGDPLRINQILLNLLNNAIKFTPQGEIMMALNHLPPEGNAAPLLEIRVRDSGIGMSQEQMERLFHAFSQADASTTRRFGGTGLGLVISRRLAEMMGGSLHAESQTNHGSCFTVRLPLPVLEGGRELGGHSLSSIGLVVVGLKHPEMARSCLSMLESFGLPALARSPESLGEALPASDDKVVVMLVDEERLQEHEIQASIEGLRSHHGPHRLLLGVLHTYPRRQHALQLTGPWPGVRCTHKPLTPSDLHDLLMELLHGATGCPVTAHHGSGVTLGPVPELMGRRVLLVEDNALNQQVASELLQLMGLAVRVAEDGAKAVEMAAAGEDDIILMDIQMPVMNGLDAARALRLLMPEPPPIIAMTANAMESDRELSLQAGMVDHVSKPIDPARLKDVLIRWMKDLPAAMGSDAESSPKTMSAMPMPTQHLPGWARVPGLDLEKALAHCAGQTSLLERVARGFLLTCRELEQEADGSETATLQRSIHTLKGQAGTLGMEGLAAEAALLERTLNELTPAQRTMAMQRFAAHVASMRSALEAALEETAPGETAELPQKSDPARVQMLTEELAGHLAAKRPRQSLGVARDLLASLPDDGTRDGLRVMLEHIQRYRFKEAAAVLSQWPHHNG